MSELTPYLCVGDARAAMQWYADVLGAEVIFEPIVMDEVASGTWRWPSTAPGG